MAVGKREGEGVDWGDTAGGGARRKVEMGKDLVETSQIFDSHWLK